MCTFLLNDLDDLERDMINHPERPLPRGDITPTLVVLLYYVCLALALLTIRFGIGNSRAEFLYYVLLTVAISYSYIVDYLPTFKAAYVAAASTLPLVVLISLYPYETSLYLIAAAVFAFILGRELCLDTLDRKGDTASPIHRIDPKRLAIAAFALEIMAFLLLSSLIATRLDLLVALFMAILLVVAARCWFGRHQFRVATGLMKVVMYVGLYFLVNVMRR
jgi:geranylgeranylglycerol-phosphate geranylgeranyltransferase